MSARESWHMRGLGIAASVVAATGLCHRLVVKGQLTLDTGLGRTVRPLGPVILGIGAPREVVFDVIAGPYLGRTPRALNDEIDVWERGSDMVLAAQRSRLHSCHAR
jgi:hypothetical protein